MNLLVLLANHSTFLPLTDHCVMMQSRLCISVAVETKHKLLVIVLQYVLKHFRIFLLILPQLLYTPAMCTFFIMEVCVYLPSFYILIHPRFLSIVRHRFFHCCQATLSVGVFNSLSMPMIISTSHNSYLILSSCCERLLIVICELASINIFISLSCQI